MEFIIDRSKWRCGDDGEYKIGKGNTELLNNSGFMCCLGQTCNQLGIYKKDLKTLGEPCEIVSKKYDNILKIFIEIKEDSYYEENIQFNSILSKDAMVINDDTSIDQKTREIRLKELFKSHGHKIKFINKAVK